MNKIKENSKKIITLILTFVICITVLISLLIASSSIPNEAIYENMVTTIYNTRQSEAFEYTYHDSMNSLRDNYADIILLNVSWNMGVGNPFVSAFNTRYHDGGDKGELQGIIETVMKNTPPNTDYTRYFHGMAIFVRFMHLFTDMNGIKAWGFILFVLFAAITIIMLIIKKHNDIAIAMVISLLATNSWYVFLSMEYQPAFIITFMMCPIFLIYEKKNDFSLILLSLISGVFIAFFDFLTTETMTILIPLIMVSLIRIKERRTGDFKKFCFLILKCLIAWGIAYISAFAVKWLLASLVTNENMFETALSAASVRFGGAESQEDTVFNAFSSVASNFSMLFGTSYRENVYLAISVIVICIVTSTLSIIKAGNTRKEILVILSLSLIVVLRYFLLANHSYMHCFFTYRALSSYFFGIISVFVLSCENIKGRDK